MSETREPGSAAPPSLQEMQHWTWVIGRAQQMMLEAGLDIAQSAPAAPPFGPLMDPTPALRATAGFWADTMDLWQRFLDPEQIDDVRL